MANGRLLVQPLDAEAPSVLAGSAPMVFALLEHSCSRDELVSALAFRYPDDDAAVIEAGVESGLLAMHDAGIIVMAP